MFVLSLQLYILYLPFHLPCERVDVTRSVSDPILSVCPQVNREIVSGLKYVQQTYRKALRSECF